MISFVVGVSPDAPNLEARMAALIEECMNFEGLVTIHGSEEYPNQILLSFRDRESATAAQWLMELGGSEPRKGGAGREEGGEGIRNTDSDHGQPGDREGGGGYEGRSEGGGLPEDLL